MPEKPGTGVEFLKTKYRELHKTKEVKHEQQRRKRAGEKTTQKPQEMIRDFMKVLEKTHLSHRDDPKVMDRIKRHYHKKHVIKEKNIPQSYWNAQAKMMIEEGRGGDLEMAGIEKKTFKDKKGKERTDYIFPDNLKRQNAEVIIADQESTLDNWTDYLASPDADAYPTWAKYWAYNNMVKLSTYDKEKKRFGNRRKDTVAPFPDLNREALSYVVDAITKKAKKEHIPAAEDSPEFKQILQSENFGKLYAWAIEKVTPAEEHELRNTKGKWIKYDQNSDHMPLVKSLQGHGTGWCTAGEETAKAQLKSGDFYVYYSEDQKGNPNIPRVAIRMEQRRIAEVRGIAPDQNLDPYIGEVIDKKLKDFGPEGEKYQKKVAGMKRLTEIKRLHQAGQELTKEDLRFLYEIDDSIEGFGYRKDPRIEKIINERDQQKDLALIIGCKPEQISTTTEEALSGNILYHHKNLDLGNVTSAKGLKLPMEIGGTLNLPNLVSAEGLKLPDKIHGSLILEHLESAEGLNLPNIINGSISLQNLKSIDGLSLPDTIRGNIYLNKLTTAKGLKLPNEIHGGLYLSKLTSAKGLKLPEKIGESLSLENLKTAEGLKLPDEIGKYLKLSNLTSAKGLKLPDKIGGSLKLSNLTSAEGLKLPDEIGRDIDLRSLKSAKGLKLPITIPGNLYLHNLTSVEGLSFPDKIGGTLGLLGLTTAKGLKLPEDIGGNLHLDSLTSAEDLNLPNEIGGNLYLNGLTSVKGLKLPNKIGGHINLPNISSTEKVKIRKKRPDLLIS